MIFVLDTAIGIGIWMPFTIGKTAALLSVRTQRFGMYRVTKLSVIFSAVGSTPIDASLALAHPSHANYHRPYRGHAGLYSARLHTALCPESTQRILLFIRVCCMECNSHGIGQQRRHRYCKCVFENSMFSFAHCDGV